MKLNDKGFIPNPKTLDYKGEKCYYWKTRNKFGMFKGIAKSKSILDKLNPSMKVIIEFEDGRSKECGVYLTTVDEFIVSDLRYANTDEDVQKIVPFSKMEKIK